MIQAHMVGFKCELVVEFDGWFQRFTKRFREASPGEVDVAIAVAGGERRWQELLDSCKPYALCDPSPQRVAGALVDAWREHLKSLAETSGRRQQ